MFNMTTLRLPSINVMHYTIGIKRAGCISLLMGSGTHAVFLFYIYQGYMDLATASRVPRQTQHAFVETTEQREREMQRKINILDKKGSMGGFQDRVATHTIHSPLPI